MPAKHEAQIVALLLVALAIVVGCRATNRLPVVRVDAFESNSPPLKRFADDLTRDVVKRLTAVSVGRYTLATTTSGNADYVISGRVLTLGPQTEIAAELIRVANESHVSAIRLDRGRPIALLSRIRRQEKSRPVFQNGSRLRMRSVECAHS